MKDIHMSEHTSQNDFPETIAAIDLGSNSFHMIVAQVENGQLRIIDRLREMVRLGAGLDANKQITPEARQRALDCLSRFGERLHELPHHAVRAVGTNTLRRVRDGGVFLREAEQALAHRIEIIAGREEARLIYVGVAHDLAPSQQKRLIVDIGGGSTELIIGREMKPLAMESLFMGCVSFSQRYFPDGGISKQAMNNAIIAGRLEIRPHQHIFDSHRWSGAVGSSGTIRAIRDVVIAAGWSKQGITRKSLKKLRKAMIKAGNINNVKLEGISDDRRPVFAGGVAVLSAVFKALNIKRMQVSDLALREGLLYELLGGIQHHDIRGKTVDTLVKRYGLDEKQGRIVADTATKLLVQVAEDWHLAYPEARNILNWAARLHEIGLVISHGGFHKHGAYILENSDLAGFSRQQQIFLATLVRGHRRKLAGNQFSSLPNDLQTDLRRLCVILRLSVLLHRGRSHIQKPMLKMSVSGNCIDLRFPAGWLEDHPLTQAELEAEAIYLAPVDFKLTFH